MGDGVATVVGAGRVVVSVAVVGAGGAGRVVATEEKGVVGETIVELEEVGAGDVVVVLESAALVVPDGVGATITVGCTGLDVSGADVS